MYGLTYLNYIRLIVVLFTLLSGDLWAQMAGCDLWSDVKSKREQSVDNEIDKLLIDLSNIRTFSKIADSTFHSARKKKDIKVDNQIISQSPSETWAERKDIDPTNKKEVFQKWRKEFFGGIILPSFSKLKKYEKILIEDKFNQLNLKYFPDERKKYYQDVFDRSKKLIKVVLQKGPIDKTTKATLIKLITESKINWFNKIEGSQYELSPSRFLDGLISYNVSDNSISIGVRAATIELEDSLISIFAQELAHAFDPCRWSVQYPKKKFPFESVVQCLRSKESIAARARESKKLDTDWVNGKFLPEQVKVLKSYPSCNTAIFPLGEDQREQINLAFADWFSAEVLSSMKKVSPQFRKNLCSETLNIPFLARASGTTRMIRIYLANPILRKKTGYTVSGKINYCKWMK